MGAVRTRIAPTPSGFLHAGNAVAFVLAWLMARVHPAGRLHLRIDDIDGLPDRPDLLDDIFRTLDWLGLDWDSGPTSVAAVPAWSQRRRFDAYHAVIRHLREHGRTFACGCSRAEIARRSPNRTYPGTCVHRHLPYDGDTAVRIVTPPPSNPVAVPDLWKPCNVDLATALPWYVVRMRNGVPAYQVASVVDDVMDGITVVVRGADLLPSSAAQRFLAAQVPSCRPFLDTVFLHHGLLLDDTGRKLSKSSGATALRTLYASGQPPASVVRLAGRMLGCDGPETAAQLLDAVRQNPTVIGWTATGPMGPDTTTT